MKLSITCPYCGEEFSEGRWSFYALACCVPCRQWEERHSRAECEARILEQLFKLDEAGNTHR